MLLGGICSAATRPIAECAHLMNLIQVHMCQSKELYPISSREFILRTRGGGALDESTKPLTLKSKVLRNNNNNNNI